MTSNYFIWQLSLSSFVSGVASYDKDKTGMDAMARISRCRFPRVALTPFVRVISPMPTAYISPQLMWATPFLLTQNVVTQKKRDEWHLHVWLWAGDTTQLLSAFHDTKCRTTWMREPAKSRVKSSKCRSWVDSPLCFNYARTYAETTNSHSLMISVLCQ